MDGSEGSGAYRREIGHSLREQPKQARRSASPGENAGLDAAGKAGDVGPSGALATQAREQAQPLRRLIAVPLHVLGTGGARDVHLHIERGVVAVEQVQGRRAVVDARLRLLQLQSARCPVCVAAVGRRRRISSPLCQG